MAQASTQENEKKHLSHSPSSNSLARNLEEI